MIFRLLGVQTVVILLGFWISERALILYGKESFWMSVGVFFIIYWLISAILWKVFFTPLTLLLKKAKKLGEGIRAPAVHPAPEWVELELTLDQMHQALTEKQEELLREHQGLKVLLRSISDAVLAVDLQGNSLFANEKFASLFSGDAKARKQPGRLTQWFRTPEVLNAFQTAFSSGQSQRVEMEIYLASENLPRHFQCSIAPLRKKKAGEIYGAMGIFHDVTTLKRAEKIRIDFVANVSHELRTPLTAIRGYADTLTQDVKEQRMESVSDFVAAINRNVGRLMNLINDLLDLSSLESNSVLKKQEIQTREISEHVIQSLEQIARGKGQKISLDVVSGAGVVTADPRRVEQVMVNLIGNALKYIPQAGQVQVTWKQDVSGKKILLSVKDNGPGIEPEHQARLFERFYRVDQARSREMGGTGLGLAIVKHIMLAHGGSVEVHSEFGKGAEFVCCFGPST